MQIYAPGVGFAARFASGYLSSARWRIRSAPEGPAGPTATLATFARLVRSTMPGAGWIGLDPTSGLLARAKFAVFHLRAAPGAGDRRRRSAVCSTRAETTFGHEMRLTRIYEETERDEL